MNVDLAELPLPLLDVGGEGRYIEAWNLNRSPVKTLGRDKGLPIPRLILGRADAIPLPDRSVRKILVERTPLTRSALLELLRVIIHDGTVILRHAPLPEFDPHALACALLPGRSARRGVMVAGRQLQETRFTLQSR